MTKHAATIRSEHLHILTTPQLKKTIREAAKADGVTVSHWIEQLAEREILRRRIRVR